jgi:GT2 family glycosyltransferase
VKAHAAAGIVIVHWRGMADLLECLESVATAAAGGVPVPVVVAVNGPDDFDEAAARAACPGVRVAMSPTNLGYAGGCNLGWRALAGDGVEAVLFLNNDVVIPPDLVDAVAQCLREHPDAGIAGPPVVYYGQPDRLWAIGGTIHRVLGYTRHVGFGDAGLPRAGRYVDYVNGSAIAVRYEVLERLNGWDESYFHFFDETDLCERARAAGYRSYACATTPVQHKVSATTGHRGSSRFTRVQAYYFARNRMRFVERRFVGWRRPLALAAQVALLLPYECAKAVAAGNAGEARGRIEGVFDGIRGRRGQRKGGW